MNHPAEPTAYAWYLNNGDIELTLDEHCPVAQTAWSHAAALYDLDKMPSAVISDVALDGLVTLLMGDDPCVLKPLERALLAGFAHNQAVAYGYAGWIEYWHRHQPKVPT